MANNTFGFQEANNIFGFQSLDGVFGFQFLGYSYPQTLINAFIYRVIMDGGTYEAESCQLAQLTALNNIS
jgi:hypothetical protein